jgi:hypothetical protein
MMLQKYFKYSNKKEGKWTRLQGRVCVFGVDV